MADVPCRVERNQLRDAVEGAPDAVGLAQAQLDEPRGARPWRRAVKSVFIAEHIACEELRREIHEGLPVVENWNSANADLFYGKAGTIGGTVSITKGLRDRPTSPEARGLCAK